MEAYRSGCIWEASCLFPGGEKHLAFGPMDGWVTHLVLVCYLQFELQ